jgi:predicted RNase H-like HicB family nuclease
VTFFHLADFYDNMRARHMAEHRWAIFNGRGLAPMACAQSAGTTNGEKMMRQVIIYPGEDGFWVAECPSLPGCITQGATREDAVCNIKEAIQEYIAALEEDGLPTPEERFQALLVAV